MTVNVHNMSRITMNCQCRIASVPYVNTIDQCFPLPVAVSDVENISKFIEDIIVIDDMRVTGLVQGQRRT